MAGPATILLIYNLRPAIVHPGAAGAGVVGAQSRPAIRAIMRSCGEKIKKKRTRNGGKKHRPSGGVGDRVAGNVITLIVIAQRVRRIESSFELGTWPGRREVGPGRDIGKEQREIDGGREAAGESETGRECARGVRARECKKICMKETEDERKCEEEREYEKM